MNRHSITSPIPTRTPHFQVTFLGLLLSLFILISFIPSQAHAKLTNQQQDFLDAWEAIKKNDRPAIAKYKKRLKGYPLLSYIQYHDYRRNINKTPDTLILEFLNENPNYLGTYLRNRWLKKLASQKKWKTFLTHYQPAKSIDLQCHHTNALIERNQGSDRKTALSQAKTLWKSHAKLPKACYPVDNWLRNNKYLTAEIVWQRIDLAIQKRQFSRARTLMKDLSKKDQSMVKQWIRIVRKPSLIKKPLDKKLSPYVASRAFVQAAKKLASKDPVLAKKLLDQYQKNYHLSKTQILDLERRIALRAAYKYKPASEELLNLVNTQGDKNEETLRWQAQIALKKSNWLDLMDAINLMPKEMQQKTKWQYWKARAFEQTKQNDQAQKIYRQLAKKRDYYGFLSADKAKLPYRFNPKPVSKLNHAQLIKKYPALQRIKELLAVDWPKSSRSEWHHLLKEADENDLTAIAVMASEWRQHPQAIRSLAVAKQWDQLELRFPTPHKEPVMLNAEKNKIDPAWIYGIIRRESAFNPETRSSAGAVGLMQLMPKTAKYIGQQIGVKQTSWKHLTSAKNNIELGSAYMAYLSERYQGNIVLATAAYNAGPHRVKRWTKGQKNFPADQWVDTITFSETRAYVKAVLEYTTIFKSRLNGNYDRLRDIMPTISESK